MPIFGLMFLVGCSPNESASIEEILNTPEEQSQENPVKKNPIIIDDSRNKVSLLAYFEALIANEQIIIGQQCGDAPDTTTSYYNTYVDMLADETGRHVGLVGADFGWSYGDNYPVGTLIDHWQEGGLVTVSWHADNPFVNGVDVYWDTVENKDKIQLKALLKDAPYSVERQSYRRELDRVGGALQKLRDAGVTVIWRPFHEMNGDFFWWGTNAHSNQQTNEADYKALWVDLYNTLTYDYGFDNLIWAYSVVPSETWYASVTAYYPGDDYVDLVGMDYYGIEPDFPHYEELKALGKPLVMSESGPRESGYGNWDMMEFADKLKGKAAYFLQWHSWNGAKVAIRDNNNIMELMNSETGITRDEILPISF
jgi:mannan endo-1,4-beta-mannosidase